MNVIASPIPDLEWEHLGQPNTEDGSPKSCSADWLDKDSVSPTFLRVIPRDFAREHLLVLIEGCPPIHPSTEVHATMNPQSTYTLVISSTTSSTVVHNVIVHLKRTLDRAVQTIVLDTEEAAEMIARLIDEAYTRFASNAVAPNESHSVVEIVEHDLSMESGNQTENDVSAFESTPSVEQLLLIADRELLSTEGKGRVVLLMDRMLFDALGENASDIHLQPLEGRALVRYRIDGVLHDRHSLTKELSIAIVSRIKIMGRMDIAERRIPQDGRSTVTIASRPIDLRISTLPTSHGERAVVRLLDQSSQRCDFEQLGMPSNISQAYLNRASCGHGIILVTGPTGSGKTTTLYATLRLITTDERNVMTIEDPIEYELSGAGIAISQSQVNEKKGITFATGLRHILRQDPDVIMIGEIRDAQTARVAIQSSLTGHLVFSTLHTNDAPSAVVRLIDLGVEPYLVSASLTAVLAQRLVRRIHMACAGAGCPACRNTGIHGRVGLFELLLLNESLREMISSGATLVTLRAQASTNGWRSLHDEGKLLVAQGMTTPEEIDRVVEKM